MSDWDSSKSDDYSPAKFYVHSRDKYNKEKGTIKWNSQAIPQSISRVFAEAIASKKYPELKTGTDVVRDCLFHRAQQLAEILEDKEMKEALLKDIMEDRINEMRLTQEREEKRVQDIAETLGRCDPADIDDVVKEGRQYLEMMRWNKSKRELRNVLDRYRPEP